MRGPPLWSCAPDPSPCEDHLLPYMADERHPEDTLFFVAEEDFRFYKGDSQAVVGVQKRPLTLEAHWQQLLASEAEGSATEIYAARQMLREATLRAGGKRVYPPESAAEPFAAAHERVTWRSASKPERWELAGVSSELLDLVHICTAAKRVGGGGLVWLSFETTRGAKPETGHRRWVRGAPGHGTTLVAVTAECARKMHANFNAWFSMDHFDISLRWCLDTNDDATD